MRVAAIKAHMTMGTFARDPATGAGPDTPTAGSQVGGVWSAGDSSGPAGSNAAMPHAFGIKDSSRAPASIGIDVAESRKGLDLVALDRERLIAAAESRLTVDEVVGTVVSLRPAVACIDSPSGWSRSGRSRLAERQLARLAGRQTWPPLLRRPAASAITVAQQCRRLQSPQWSRRQHGTTSHRKRARGLLLLAVGVARRRPTRVAPPRLRGHGGLVTAPLQFR
jgi:Protein of unknown function (DUF429)